MILSGAKIENFWFACAELLSASGPSVTEHSKVFYFP